MKHLILLLTCLTTFQYSFSQCILGSCSSGYGEKKINNIKTYKGNFKYSEFNGYGEVWVEDVVVYKGEWKEGRESGYSVAYWSDGNLKYHGEYLNGKRHGYGTFYTASGKVDFAGRFIDDKPQEKPSSLPVSIQTDKFLLEAKGFIDEENYKRAIVSLNKILSLNVTPPSDFYYHHGKACCLGKSYEMSVSSLIKYLNEVGQSGEFYSEALTYLSQAEDNSTTDNFAEQRYKIANCTKCRGSGYYDCTKCNGEGSYYCGTCSTCYLCNGTGLSCAYVEWPCTSWTTCPNCFGTGNNCPRGHGSYTNEPKWPCSGCDGDSKLRCSH